MIAGGDVAIVPKRVRLHMRKRLFAKTDGERMFSHKQFVAAARVFDSGPYIIPRLKAQRGLEQVAVLLRVILERARSSPNKRAGPIAAQKKRAVVHQRGGRPGLVFRGKQGLRT